VLLQAAAPGCAFKLSTTGIGRNGYCSAFRFNFLLLICQEQKTSLSFWARLLHAPLNFTRVSFGAQRSERLTMKANDAGAVLIHAPTEASCRMCAEWLVRAAELEAVWTKALQDEKFRYLVADLCGFGEPNFEAGALQLLANIKSRSDISVFRFDLDNLGENWTDVDALLRIEFTMMVMLGFFKITNKRYEMAVPETATITRIKQVALDILATKIEADGVEFVCPEVLLNTMPASDAEAERLNFMAIREFEDVYRRGPMQ
jgi:hypothetical protein